MPREAHLAHTSSHGDKGEGGEWVPGSPAVWDLDKGWERPGTHSQGRELIKGTWVLLSSLQTL